jgi:hypothetical protein
MTHIDYILAVCSGSVVVLRILYMVWNYLKHRSIVRRNEARDRNIAEGEARAAKLAAEVADRWRD